MKKVGMVLSVILIVLLIGTVSVRQTFAQQDETESWQGRVGPWIPLVYNLSPPGIGVTTNLYSDGTNIGIGTMTPEGKLVVAVEGGTRPTRTVFNGSDAAFGIIFEGSDTFTVDYDGNVGIGTTNPRYTLDVEGTVQAHEYITGDITFQKDGKKLWRMFEDEEGLYVENLKSGETFNFLAMQKQLKEQHELILSLAEKVQALEASLK